MTSINHGANAEFSISWEIQIEAPTAEAAARKALEIQRNPDSIATAFTVRNDETGDKHEVDLFELDCCTDDANDQPPASNFMKAEIIPADSPAGIDLEVPIDRATTEGDLRAWLEAHVPWPAVMTHSDIAQTLEGFFESYREARAEMPIRGLFEFLVAEGKVEPQGYEVIPDTEQEETWGVQGPSGVIEHSFSSIYEAFGYAWREFGGEECAAEAPMGLLVNAPAGYGFHHLPRSSEWCWQRGSRLSEPFASHITALWDAWKDLRSRQPQAD